MVSSKSIPRILVGKFSKIDGITIEIIEIQHENGVGKIDFHVTKIYVPLSSHIWTNGLCKVSWHLDKSPDKNLAFFRAEPF